MELEILDISKNKYKLIFSKTENEFKFSLESIEKEKNKKYLLITTLEKLKESDQNFGIFEIVDFSAGLKQSIDANQYLLKLDEETNSMNLEIKNNFLKNALIIKIPEKDLEKQNIAQIGDIITTIRNLSNDDDWIECNGQEIDPNKYPKLASLLGNDLFPSEWYIGSSKFNYETWYYFAKSKTTYSCIYRYNEKKYSCDIQNYYLYFTNKKFSNNWSSIIIINSDVEFGKHPNNLVYINNTWIIPGFSYDGFSHHPYIWYCQSDIPSNFKEQKISENFYIEKGNIVYGNGYYVISGLLQRNNYSHLAILYSQELNSNWSIKEISTENSTPCYLIFQNNTFAFCFLGQNQDSISIAFSKGKPLEWITTQVIPPDGYKKSSPSLAYIDPYWMIFYTVDKKPYICFSDDINKKEQWEKKEAPFYDKNYFYDLNGNSSQSQNIITLIGKKNNSNYM